METLKKKLSSATRARGVKADIRRQGGFSGSQLDGYINGTASPVLEQLDRLAAALGVEAWELIRPESEDDRDHAISDLWSSADINEKDHPEMFPGFVGKNRKELARLLSLLTDVEVGLLLKGVEVWLVRLRKHPDGVSDPKPSKKSIKDAG
jgi:transcriptional regulator with XRE-family HTH domain